MRTIARVINSALLVVILFGLTSCHPFVLPAHTPSSKIAMKTAHGRFVIAQGKDKGWSLWQSDDREPGECGWFTLYDLGEDELGNHGVALKTCWDRFVTAPRRGTSRLDREVWQESGQGDCGQFTLERRGDGFALKTCAGKYLTAGDDGREWPVPWTIVVENPKVDEWEMFRFYPSDNKAPPWLVIPK